ncbi:MAG TPA: hypothetical protein VM913_08755 [Sphingomicrobium sp.]|nr:hypothetical protein [Sphingomicrobium sp.]
MDEPRNNDPTPRSGVSGTIRAIGYAVVALLILSIVLLALGVVNFEQIGIF